MTKNSRQTTLENKKSVRGEIKSIFHHFRSAFSYQKLYQTLECAFKHNFKNCINPLVYVLFSITAIIFQHSVFFS